MVAFFPALVFPLRSAPIWISPSSSFCAKPPSDFFFAGFGVGVWCRFDFEEAAGSGVSRGVGLGVASSSSSDFGFALRTRGDSCASCDSLSSLVDSCFADFALRIGVGDFFSEGSVFSCDSSFANFAWGIAVGAFSGVAEALCFFADLSLDAFATGLGDFFGFGDGEECASICSDSSRRLFSSSPTCAQRRLAKDCARGERSCEPNAKAHHCDGA